MRASTDGALAAAGAGAGAWSASSAHAANPRTSMAGGYSKMRGTRVAPRTPRGYMSGMQAFEPTDRPPETTSLARRALLLGVQALAVCAALWPMLGGGFVYDDLWLVAQNPNLATFGQMWRSLGGSYWDFIDESSSRYVGSR